jgi:hypothetical protein
MEFKHKDTNAKKRQISKNMHCVCFYSICIIIAVNETFFVVTEIIIQINS